MQTLTVEVLNKKVYRLLEDLADLQLIRLHTQSPQTNTTGAGFETTVRRAGFATDVILHVADDFNEPLDDFKDYMP